MRNISAPRVFISYSHDKGHSAAVLAFANRLRRDGLDAWLDRYEDSPPEGWPRWMQQQISEADFVLLVCTPTYRRRFEGTDRRTGKGATWEGLIATQLLYEQHGRNRNFIPVLLHGASPNAVPLLFAGSTVYRFPEQYGALYRRLINQPAVGAPPVGERRVPPASPLAEHRPLSDGVPSPETNPDAFAALTREIKKLTAAIETLHSRSHAPHDNKNGGSDTEVPFTREWLWRGLSRKFGRRVAAAIFALAIGSVWVATYVTGDTPFVGAVLQKFGQAKRPIASPEQFNVGVGRLANDVDGLQRQKLRVALQDLPGVKVQFFDRLIRIREDDDLGAAKARAHQEARGFLKDLGFNALLWGEVLGTGGDVALKLYWTPAEGLGEERSLRHFQFERDQSVPQLFWDELQDVLRLLAVSSALSVTEDTGRFVADRAWSLVARVRSLLTAPSSNLRSKETTAELRFALANALVTLAEQTGRSEHFLEAIESYKAVLDSLDRQQNPLDWATLNNSLGAALFRLGEKQASTSLLQDALAHYRLALQERTRARVPLEWARTQNNIGAALTVLGDRGGDVGWLNEAAAAFREALKEYSRERFPQLWVMTMINLGSVVARQGTLETETGRLREAVMIFHEALEQCDRSRTPLTCANLHNNLGNTLLALGGREPHLATLQEAVVAYREALEERTRGTVPLEWAQTQNNLGNALRELGRREVGNANLEAAVAAYREALQEYTRERAPIDWAMTQNNLCTTLDDLGRRESRTARLEQAADACREALKERPRESVPLLWAQTHNNLGTVLTTFGDRTSSSKLLRDAIAEFELALQEHTRERSPLDWANSKTDLGTALQVLGILENRREILELAVEAYQKALEERTRERVPLEFAITQATLGSTLVALGRREASTERFEEALAAFRAALSVFTPASSPYYYEDARRMLHSTLAELRKRRGF